MIRRSSLAVTLSSITAIAGVSALGAFLIVAPGQAASLRSTSQMPVPPSQTAQLRSPPAAANLASTNEPRRTVRVVYVGPITAK